VLVLVGIFCLPGLGAFDIKPVCFERLDKSRITNKRIKLQKIISRTRKFQFGSYVLAGAAGTACVAFLGHWIYSSYYPEQTLQKTPSGNIDAVASVPSAQQDMLLAEFIQEYRDERTFGGIVKRGAYQGVQFAFYSFLVATLLGVFRFVEGSSVDAVTRWLTEDEFEFFARLELGLPGHVQKLARSSQEYITDLKKMIRQETLDTVKSFSSYFAGTLAMDFSIVVNDIEDILALSWLCFNEQEYNKKTTGIAFLEMQYQDIVTDVDEMACFYEQTLKTNTLEDVLALERKCSLLMRRFSVRMQQWLKLMTTSALREG